MSAPQMPQHANLVRSAEQLLSEALKAGATDAEVCGAYSDRTRIILEKQDYHLISNDEGYQLGLRVLLGKRQGFTSCNTLNPKDLKEMAIRAVELAAFAPENPHYNILPNRDSPKGAPANTWDEAIRNLPIKTQQEWTSLLFNEATSNKFFRLNEGSTEVASSVVVVYNSKGTKQWEKDSALSWSLMGMASEGDHLTSFDYFSQMSRRADEVPAQITRSVKHFTQHVFDQLKEGASKTYRGRVVFSPRAVCDILLNPLLYHLNGRSVLEGTSRYQVKTCSTQILDPRITLTDDPWKRDRTGYSLFDREGVPTRPMSLISKGVLSTLLLDGYAASGLKLPPTGHASGGPSGTPTVGSHTLCLEGGTRPLKELLKTLTQDQGDFLIVNRFSGQEDPVTGEFSGVAKGGEWWSNGTRSHFVKETLISGNFFDSLGKWLIDLSRESEVVDSSDESPWVICDGISVTSG